MPCSAILAPFVTTAPSWLRMLLPVALALLWVTQVFTPIHAAPATVGKRQTTPTVITSCTVPNTAALTFDDGPYLWIKVCYQPRCPQTYRWTISSCRVTEHL
jgi:hypothetical protein